MGGDFRVWSVDDAFRWREGDRKPRLTVAHFGFDDAGQRVHLREAVDDLDVLAGGVAGDALHLDDVQVLSDADDDGVDTGDARLDSLRDCSVGLHVRFSIGEQDEKVGRVLSVTLALDKQFVASHLQCAGDVCSSSRVGNNAQGLWAHGDVW